RLQRSVTDTRRSRSGRSWASRSTGAGDYSGPYRGCGPADVPAGRRPVRCAGCVVSRLDAQPAAPASHTCRAVTLFDPAPPPVDADPEPARFVRVALKLPVETEFTYAVPPGMRLRTGNRVLVPFRNKVMPGVVVAEDADPGDV